jgi:hypothetical protein
MFRYPYGGERPGEPWRAPATMNRTAPELARTERPAMRKAMTITDVTRIAYLPPTSLPPGMELGVEAQARVHAQCAVHLVQFPATRVPAKSTYDRCRCWPSA